MSAQTVGHPRYNAITNHDAEESLISTTADLEGRTKTWEDEDHFHSSSFRWFWAIQRTAVQIRINAGAWDSAFDGAARFVSYHYICTLVSCLWHPSTRALSCCFLRKLKCIKAGEIRATCKCKVALVCVLWKPYKTRDKWKRTEEIGNLKPLFVYIVLL